MSVNKAQEGLTGKLEEAKKNGNKNGLKIDGKWYLGSAKVFDYASEKLIDKPVVVKGTFDDGTISMLAFNKPQGGGNSGGGKGGWKGNGGGKSFPKKDDDYALGQQVGNAITNAATICGAGTSVEDLFTVAEQIIVKGNALKEKIKSGKLSASAASSSPAKQEASGFEDDSASGDDGFSGDFGDNGFDDEPPFA